MTDREKIELKLEIFEDILQCIHFNFGSMSEDIDRHLVEKKIVEYQTKISEMDK